MKAKFITPFFLLLCTFICAQKVTIEQLETLASEDFNEFTKFAISKQYKLFNSKDKNASFTYIDEQTGSIHLLERDETGANPFIKYMFNNSSEYSEILQQLEKRGYNYSGNENTQDGVFLNYTNISERKVVIIMLLKDFYKIYVSTGG